MANSPVKFHGVTPILKVESMAKSLAYYRDVLGFEVDWEWGKPTGFACVSRDDVCLFFCEGAQGASGTWISLFVEDVDALHEQYEAAGATIIQAPINYSWGMREMNVEDPDGHRLRIGQNTEEPPDGIPLPE